MNPKKNTVRTIQKMRDNGESIGSVPGCSGQLLVTPDVPGMFDALALSFAKRYQNFNGLMKETFARYAEEVRTGIFPGEEHSSRTSDDVLEVIAKEFGAV